MKGDEGMREFKFRIWDMDRKVMLGSRYVIFYDGDFYENYRDLEDGILIENIAVMQYTEKKKKNGVEICEGDIVETVYNGEVFAGVVVYDLSEVDFKVTDGKEKYGRNFQYLAGNDENEVIGNRYENPGLLKEEPTC